MTNDTFPNSEKIFEQMLARHPIVEQASASISEMYKTIIPELTQQMTSNLEKSPESEKVHTAVDEMTVEMIKEMNSRIARILGNS